MIISTKVEKKHTEKKGNSRAEKEMRENEDRPRWHDPQLKSSATISTFIVENNHARKII